MDTPKLSAASRQIEALLDSHGNNPLTAFIHQQSVDKLKASGSGSFLSGSMASQSDVYDVYAVRRSEPFGDEIFRLAPVLVGSYSENVLYGIAGSPLLRFRSEIQRLKEQADRAASASVEELEYGHHTALVWAEIARLKDLIGASPEISEIVSELRTARFQFLGKDTPKEAIVAIASALNLLTNANRLDSELVDRIVDLLEEGGIDSLAPDVLRDLHA